MNISSSSLSLSLATFRSQTLGALFSTDTGSGKRGADGASSFDFLTGSNSPSFSLPSLPGMSSIGASSGLSNVAGRNMTLNDPESAYKMMSNINKYDVSFKAEFSELSQMNGAIDQLKGAAQSLGAVTNADSNETIKANLQAFANQYNQWIDRFTPDVQKGGVLANTQTAQVALNALDHSVRNMFNGAKDDVRGLTELGFAVDSKTKLVTIDGARLDQVLSSNRQGAVSAVTEFSKDFAEAANFLTTDGKFIRRQLSNLDGAIDYIRDNVSALQKEFGTGEAFKPSGQTAKALAAYNQMFLA